MTIKTISHSKSIETYSPTTGLKTWYKFDMMGELEEGESRETAIAKLVNEVNAAFGAINNDAYNFTETLVPIEQPTAETNLQTEKTAIAIENSKTLSELELHFENALRYGLRKEYETKLKELS